MTLADADTPRLSPSLSLWWRPRDTISQIIAGDPRRHVLILAAIGGIATFAVELIGLGYGAELVDWRMAAAVAVAGLLVGIVGVYLNALVLRWSARLFGGRASQAQLRAVVAWGLLPNILALVVCLGALAWLKFFAGGAAPPMLLPVLQTIAGLLALWAFVITLLMFARVEGFGFWRTIASGAVFSCFMLAFAMVFRTFLFQPFNIPSGAQIPTLLIGDYLFVSKYAYGYTHYSLPFSPRLFAGRILASEPQRGDTVVFRLPKDDTTDYIKRIVGLPGDRIQMRNGELYINGAAVKRERIDDFAMQDDGGAKRVKRWRETLPNGVSYETLDLQDNGFLDNTQEYTVPAGHYFMMGDNRDNSSDSRMLNQMGYVPLENLVGRAAMIFFSIDRDSGRVRTERIGTLVR